VLNAIRLNAHKGEMMICVVVLPSFNLVCGVRMHVQDVGEITQVGGRNYTLVLPSLNRNCQDACLRIEKNSDVGEITQGS